MPFIGIDWGSSSFRAYLISETGKKLDIIHSKEGVFQIKNRAFADYVQSTCQSWLQQYPGISIFMSGMIGSRNGWQEIPYQHCPLPINQLANHLQSIKTNDTLNINIVPGVSCNNVNQAADVMRGEEVQLFGALQLLNKSDGLVCLPGTHSKWAQLNNNTLIDFATFLTGELYELLTKHSSLSNFAASLSEATQDITSVDNINPTAFIRGVKYSQMKGGLLHHVFTARAAVLLKDLAEDEVNSFLSGVTIGHELQGAIQLYPQYLVYPQCLEIMTIGSQALQLLYSLAAEVYGIKVTKTNADDVMVAGLFEILKHYSSDTQSVTH